MSGHPSQLRARVVTPTGARPVKRPVVLTSSPTNPPVDASPVAACETCSACCDHPEPWATIHVTATELAKIPAEFVETVEGTVAFRRVTEHKMRKVGNRCAALVGTVGVDARCGIYVDRPTVCRQFNPATRVGDCNMCRAPHGLTPLTIR